MEKGMSRGDQDRVEGVSGTSGMVLAFQLHFGQQGCWAKM